jgi:hypothetical protein
VGTHGLTRKDYHFIQWLGTRWCYVYVSMR